MVETVRLGDGRTVMLGRVRPIKVTDTGRFLLLEYADGTFRVRAKFGPHFDATKRPKTGTPLVTMWLDKCKAAIKLIYGNDVQGDCVIASLLHMIGGWTGNESGTPALSTQSEALKNYKTICGPGDQGCIITDVLDYAKTKGLLVGGTPHKIDDYCAVDTTDMAQIQAVIELFGPAVKLGINLPNEWYQSVNGDGFVWNNTNSASVGGHDVPIIDVNVQGVVIATWGYYGTITWAGLANTSIVEEAWLSLAPDWYNNQNLAPNGVDSATLRSDLALVAGGGTPPLPGPTPIPPGPNPPPPGPGPNPNPVLFSFTTRKDKAAGQVVSYKLPVALPKGVYDTSQHPTGAAQMEEMVFDLSILQLISDLLKLRADLKTGNLSAIVTDIENILGDL